MKITIISDTHTKHEELELPGGDLLIHCGDFMSSGFIDKEAWDFVSWLDAQDYKHKVFIAGNHDRVFENFPVLAEAILLVFKSVQYLQDSSTIIEGFKIYGSPWSPEYYDWAFALNTPAEDKEVFDKIPLDTDILITHCPPQGILDVVYNPYFEGKALGSLPLLQRTEKVNPLLHCFGHIHSSQGTKSKENTLFVNACSLGEDYDFSHSKKYTSVELDITGAKTV